MIDRLTDIQQKLGKIIWYYCLLLAATCLILAFSSCSNIRSIKSKNGIRIVKQKSDKKDYNQIDTLNDEIMNFEEKLLSHNSSGLSTAKSEETPSADVFEISSKRLPTLREQMQSLTESQEVIKTQVNTLQSDVNEIKNSIDDIKDAITIMNFNENNTPKKGGEQEEVFEDDSYNNESEFNNANESSEQDDYSVVKSDQAASKTTKPKAQAKPKQVKPKQVKQNNSLNDNRKAKPAVEKEQPKREKAVEQNNYKLTTNPEPKNLNQNVESALTFFAKKDYHEAINELNSILIKSNDSQTQSVCYYWLGESYFRIANYDEAQKFFVKSSNDLSSPKTPEALIMIGESNIRLGKIDAARSAFETFLSKFPQSRFAPRAKKMLQQL